MSRRTDLAYCAGVIDSDGSIGVKRSTYAMRVRKDATQPTYSERVSVRQVEREAVDLLKALFGGWFYLGKPYAKRGRPLWTWQVTDLNATKCLRAVLPYLRIKRKQAENCLVLRRVKEQSKRKRVAFSRGHAGGAARPAALSVSMEACYLVGKALNAVGRRDEGR